MNIIPPSKPGFAETIARCLVIGSIYALVSASVAALLGSMSRLAPSLDNILVWLLSGTLVSSFESIYPARKRISDKDGALCLGRAGICQVAGIRHRRLPL